MAYIYTTHLTTDEKQIFHEIIRKKTVKLNTCTIWLGPKTSSGYGMIRTHFRGDRIKLVAHRLIFSLHHPNVSMSKNLHVSHICHNKACIEILHLSLETASINNKRQICRNMGECTGHYGFPKCIL